MLLFLTCNEWICSKRMGIAEHTTERVVSFATVLNLQEALTALSEYQAAFKAKYCEDGYNGTIAEFRLLSVSQIATGVTEELLHKFGVEIITTSMADRLKDL